MNTLLLIQLVVISPSIAQEIEIKSDLHKIIAAQQKQSEIQQKQIADQQKQIEAQMSLLRALQLQVQTLIKKTSDMKQRSASPHIAAQQQTKSKKTENNNKHIPLIYNKKNINLEVSGHVNRAINIVDDGKNVDTYNVDNDNSESRIRFDGTATLSDDLQIGSRIELTIGPNLAGQVNQNNTDENNIFDQRWTEIFINSKQYGKLSLGKGATASYGSASVDLSKTNVISYATISDTAGGMLFRESANDQLTDIRISDVFNSLDGLNRQSRIRYDSPKYNGLQVSLSSINDGRYDGVLWWDGKGYGFLAASAVAVAYPNEDDTDHQYGGSFSLLHENTGLNFTLSTGFKERNKEQDDAKNLYIKMGWIEQFFSYGDTAFGLDYTSSKNHLSNGYDGESFGISAVQKFDEYSAEIFSLYRVHSLDKNDRPSFQNINVLSIGAKLNF